MASPSEFFIDLGVEFSYDKTAFNNLTKEVKEKFEAVSKFDIVKKKNIDEAKQLYKELYSDLIISYNRYIEAQGKGNTKIAKQSQAEIQQLQTLIQKLYDKATQGQKGNLERFGKQFEAVIAALVKGTEEYNYQINATATSTANFDKAVKQTTSGLERQQISADKITEKMGSLNQQLIKLEASYKNGSITTQQYRERLQQLSDKYERLHEQERNVYTNTDKLKNKFEETQGSLDGVSQAVATCDTKLEDMRKTSQQLQQNVERLGVALDNRTGITKWIGDFKEGLSQGAGQLTGAAAGMRTFQLACQVVRQSIQAVVSEVKELNSAMTDVQMVAGTTSSETMKMFKDYNQLAKDLSVTTKDVVAGASDWLNALVN